MQAQKSQIQFVVVLALSAGDVHVVRMLLQELEPKKGCAWVVVAPASAEALVPEQFSHGGLPLVLRDAEHDEPLRPDHVYLCPPRIGLRVQAGRLQHEPDETSCRLDGLLPSLVAEFGARTVLVLLSGTGPDGVEAARQVRTGGGLVLAHSPETAMPPMLVSAVIEAGAADLHGSAGQLASWLCRLDQLPEQIAAGSPQAAAPQFRRLLGRVSQASGLDLVQYKENTLWRQTVRRYRALGCADLGEYLDLVDRQPEELNRLQQQFMISVSSFFRDASAFESLERVLRQLVATRRAGEPLRLWVTACASGEEAYSIAILLCEILGERLDRQDVRVFATDIDQVALDQARAGLYTSQELQHLGSERRERWFTPHGGGWRIVKQVRELCVFSVHDVIRQPPYINLDLISCRNLLIYLKPEQQTDLFATFHYALRQGGLLLLGRSESVGFKSTLFDAVDPNEKLYRRNPVSGPRAPRLPAPVHALSPLVRNPVGRPEVVPPRQSLVEQARTLLIRNYVGAAVLVNTQFEPLHFFGAAQGMLTLPQASADFSLFSLCPPELRSELKALGYRMLQEGLDELRGSGALLPHGEGVRHVRPVLRRVSAEPASDTVALLVCLDEIAPPGEAAVRADNPDQPDSLQHRAEVEQLQLELADTREHLQAVIEALEASNEELQSLNEEIQSSSEELQSSNEELQSSNEELSSLNEALRLKSIELTQLNSVLANIQNSVRTGLVVVDTTGRIIRYNQLAARVFGLVPGDIGQQLYSVPCHLDLPRLRAQIDEVVGASRSLVERVHQGNFHYLMQIDPYRGSQGEGAGAVLTFTDISELHRAEQASRQSDARFRHVWEASLTGMMLVDAQGRIELVTPSLAQLFGCQAEELIGQPVTKILPAELVLRPGLPHAYEALRQASGQVQSHPAELSRRDGTPLVVQIGLSSMVMDGQTFVLVAVEDITERRYAEQALRESENRLATILDNVGASIYIKDTDYRYTYVNQTVGERHGLALADLIGHDDHAIFDDATVARLRLNDQRVIEQGERVTVEEQSVDLHSGVLRTSVSVKLPLRDRDGRIYALCGISTDITQRRFAESWLRMTASVFTHAQEAILITDSGGELVEVNEKFCDLTGYQRAEVLGRHVGELGWLHEQPELVETGAAELQRSGTWSGEVWGRRKDGRRFAALLNIAAVRMPGGEIQHYVALFSEITTLKEYQHQLELVAHYDALTRLPNRVLLAERLQHAIVRSRRNANLIALVYVDLDGFKAVNDRHGHAVGDELLMAVAQRFKEVLREGDTLARLGGDEFVIVLIDLLRPDDCRPILDRLLQVAAAPVELQDLTVQVSASLGVTLYPLDGSDPDTLLRHADQAMYQAKRAGKNHYHLFDPERDRQVRSQFERLQRIGRAIEAGELVLHYQPVVNMRSGELAGVEALVRWLHPERGLLLPGEFLPQIEDHELIVRLGEWVFDAALAQMQRWQALGLDLSVSINLAARQLQQPDFSAWLRQRLQACPTIRPERLTLEVLETAALDDVIRVSEVIDDCRGLGLRFALDDFGTGYSSLTYLRRLSAGSLKIDHSFVRDMLWDPDDLAIIEGVIGLGRVFRRRLIAEGVERVEQGELLLRLGCELAQGYAIAPPLPGDDLPVWLAQWRQPPSWAEAGRQPLSPPELALVHAEVEYREWLRRLAALV
ncbi:MAG: hypothetical protein RJA44_1361, partial [Pseudomonadota bacterium]